ncbi:MAG: quinone-dependent dihydroorotate dehydrogenase [Chloroflexi bacterium]|nr:quinone-dependent dihydroorotate dehydrogenase [Chloroflexota bacterium]
MYKSIFFPLLKRMDAETAHERIVAALSFAQGMPVGRAILQWLKGSDVAQPVSVFGLTFPNVIGMAAGFDKDVRVPDGLALMGFGHVEAGTLTPRYQGGNAHPRIFRLPSDGALINRMGFPNGGVETAVSRLHTLSLKKRNYILGVSLGKQKETPLADAANDYLSVMTSVYAYADYLAVNISSPNTPGLRELQGGNYLGHLLETLMAENDLLAEKHQIKKRPLLVKIAPDLTWVELDAILTAVQDNQIDGIIATNTTLSRDGLTDPNRGETGGLSGRPLRQRSTEIITYIHRQTMGKLPIIGVGGIQTAADVREKLDAGATLVQLYTSLIYEGPRLIGRILRDL